MKQISNYLWIAIALTVISPVAYGHLAENHSSGLDGFVHLLVDPVHVSILVIFIVLPLLMVARTMVTRRYIDRIIERIQNALF